MKTIIWVIITGFLVIGCAHSPNIIHVQEKISDFDEVDTFVTWLEDQPGIRDVEVNHNIFLTSFPPKVIVTYFQNTAKHKLLLVVENGHKLRLVKPE